MTIKSNMNGRALEYCLAKKVEEFCKNNKISISFSSETITDNERDKDHFDNLTSEMRLDFAKFANTAVSWISKEFLENARSVLLTRLPDSAGVEGDVTDMILKIAYTNSPEKEIRLSVKHHHDALKHPRLFRFPEICGVTDKQIQSDYTKQITHIWNEFILKSKELIQSPTKFKDLKLKDPVFIDNNLYAPLNTLIIGFLNRYVDNPNKIATFFNFITGANKNFYVLKNEDNAIVIKKFIDIPTPQAFQTFVIKPSTILIIFDNNWRISFRLHTASSRLFLTGGTPNTSAKYDVICQNLDKLIKIEYISKC